MFSLLLGTFHVTACSNCHLLLVYTCVLLSQYSLKHLNSFHVLAGTQALSRAKFAVFHRTISPQTLPFLFFLYFYFTSMDVLPAFVSVHHVCAGPTEDRDALGWDIGVPGPGFTNGY